MAMGEGLAHAGLDPHVEKARFLGLELGAPRTRLLMLLVARVSCVVLHVAEVLDLVAHPSTLATSPRASNDTNLIVVRRRVQRFLLFGGVMAGLALAASPALGAQSPETCNGQERLCSRHFNRVVL